MMMSKQTPTILEESKGTWRQRRDKKDKKKSKEKRSGGVRTTQHRGELMKTKLNE